MVENCKKHLQGECEQCSLNIQPKNFSPVLIAFSTEQGLHCISRASWLLILCPAGRSSRDGAEMLGDAMGDVHKLLAINPGNQKARKFKATILEKLDDREWE